MPAKNKDGLLHKLNLSEHELSLGCAAYLAAKNTNGSIDWEEFARLAGYRNPNSAQSSFALVKKKLQALTNSNAPPPGPKITPRERKYTAAITMTRKDDNFDDYDGVKSPYRFEKKTRRGEVTNKSLKRKADDDDDVDVVHILTIPTRFKRQKMKTNKSEIASMRAAEIAEHRATERMTDKEAGAKAAVKGTESPEPVQLPPPSRAQRKDIRDGNRFAR